MRFTPGIHLETFIGSLSTCKNFWSQFAHSCPHWSCNIPGIKSALRFKNKMGGTNWIRSPWQTSPPAECSPNWRNCNKKIYIYIYMNFFLLCSPLSVSLQASCFLCSKSPAHLEFVSPALWYLPTPIPAPLPQHTHIITDRPWVPRKQIEEKTVPCQHSAASGKVTETGEGSAVLGCKDCQENKREKKSSMYPFLPPLFFFF